MTCFHVDFYFYSSIYNSCVVMENSSHEKTRHIIPDILYMCILMFIFIFKMKCVCVSSNFYPREVTPLHFLMSH